MEPDIAHGHAYLEATKRALSDVNSVEEILDELKTSMSISDELTCEIARAFDARERSLFALLQDAQRHDQRWNDVQDVVRYAPLLRKIRRTIQSVPLIGKHAPVILNRLKAFL